MFCNKQKKPVIIKNDKIHQKMSVLTCTDMIIAGVSVFSDYFYK